ncbi:MAG: hypothetical protein QM500_08815 [Methylococcales bacterium]
MNVNSNAVESLIDPENQSIEEDEPCIVLYCGIRETDNTVFKHHGIVPVCDISNTIQQIYDSNTSEIVILSLPDYVSEYVNSDGVAVDYGQFVATNSL